jgi:hypothetical protein
VPKEEPLVSRTGTALARIALFATLSAALWGLSRSVPFDATSYGAWTGIVLALLSLAALVKPARWLWLPTRGRACLALCAGLAIAAVALTWPLSVSRSTRPRTHLDELLPEYQAVEYHEARTRAPLARVVDAVRQVSLAEMPPAVLLLRLRALAPSAIRSALPDRIPLLDVMLQSGFFMALDVADEHDRVYGMIGRPWEDAPPPGVHSAAEFRTFHEPGSVRAAFDFRVVDEGGGTVRVSTETRILGTDPEAQARFKRYWRMIYPGSAIIRRVWLDAIVARAERTQP